MSTDAISIIEKNIEALINDTREFSFTVLKQKVEAILKDEPIFLIEGQLNSKAVDLYLKNVITAKNNIKKEQERIKLKESKKIKYTLIESICQKLEFENQEELIKKLEELEKKSIEELKEIDIAVKN